MKRCAKMTAAMVAAAVPAWAAGAGETGEMSFLVILFLAFGALIILFQAIPGLLMLFSMLRGLLSGAPERETRPTTDVGGNK